MQDTFISVVVPVYKVEQYIGNTIKSLINQTSHRFEVVFIDDGTPDDSVQVITEAMQATDISYQIIRQENQGQGIARNTGFLNAKGKWVIFLDSDDVLQPFTIETYLQIVKENGQADVIFSKFQDVREDNIFEKSEKNYSTRTFSREKLLKNFLTRKMVFLVPGTLYNVEFLAKNQILHSNLRWSEDQHFMWTVLNKLNNAVVSEAVLYNYVHHSGESIMNVTPVDRMLDAYEKFDSLVETIDNKKVKKYLLARWCFGCVNVICRRNDEASYLKFYESVRFRSKCKRLLTFPTLSIKILAFMGLLNKKWLYKVLSKRK